MSAPRISLILPSFNQARTVVRCLESVMDQSLPAHEIIVVDSSTDETPDLIRARFPDVRLLRREEQTRPGAARNLGVRHASGDLLAFLDSDCIAGRDWLRRLYDAYDPEASPVVVGSVANGTPHAPFGTTGYLLEFSEFMPDCPAGDRHHGLSGNLLIHRSRFDAVGGFPTAIFPGEDTVFTHALHRRGDSTRFEPRARVVHMNRTGFRDLLIHQRRLGISFAAARRMEPSLPGANLLGRPWIRPLLPPVRWARMLFRLARLTDPRHLRTFLLLTPLSILALIAWTAGMGAERE